MRLKVNRWLQLVGDCLVVLSKNNVRVTFTHHRIKVKEDNTHCTGYWDDSDPNDLQLKCMITNDDSEWVSTFAHEYCHFLQWKDKPKIWHDYNSKLNGDDLYKIYNNKPISRHKLETALNIVRELELDCEKRTVWLLQQYKIPIDIRSYIRKANAYILFHNHAKVYRKWYPLENSPYMNSKILQACSSRFYDNYEITPRKLAEAFLEQYPPVRNNNLT